MSSRKQPLQIRVTGTHTTTHPPEYTHLVLRISHKASNPTSVVAGLAEKTVNVTNHLRALSLPLDPMTTGSCEVDIRNSWADGTVTVKRGVGPVVLVMQEAEPRLERDEEGWRGETAVLGTFRDWTCLRQVVGCLMSSHITPTHLDWVLSTPLRRSLESRASTGALANAHSKAKTLISSYPSAPLRPTKITDTSNHKDTSPRPPYTEDTRPNVYVNNRAAVITGDDWLKPQDVVVRSSIKVEFTC